MDTCEDNMEDTFKEDLDKIYDNLSGKTIKILNAKCGKEIYFLPIIGSESVYYISNDNGLRVI